MSCFFETEFEFWGGFGPARNFRVHEFLVCPITILSSILFRLIGKTKNDGLNTVRLPL